MELADLTSELEQLYANGNRYRVIELGHRVLDALPIAPELSILTLRALVSLGLGGPVREFLSLRKDLPDTRTIRELRESAATLPHGRVQWNELADTFATNAEAVCRYRPELRELFDSAKERLAGLHLYRCSDGGYRISRRKPGRLREWLPDLIGPRSDETFAFPQLKKFTTIVLIGLRIGPLLQRVCELTHKVLLTHSNPVCVIEADSVRFLAALHCADFSEYFCDTRFKFFIGSDAVQQFEATWASNHNLALPGPALDCCEDQCLCDEVVGAIRRLKHTRACELQERIQQLESRYKGRDVAYWLDRLTGQGPILAFTSLYTTVLQYSARDTLQALSEMGYETHMIIEENDHETHSPITLCQAILDYDPGMILLIDHLRYETPYLPKNVPLLTWIQDPMPNLLCKEAGASIGPMDFVCGYFSKCTNEYGYPPEQFEFVDIPVSMHQFHDAPLDPDVEDRYACDISFVSNASTPIDRFYEETLTKYEAAHRPLLEAVYRRVVDVLDDKVYFTAYGTMDLVRSLASECSYILDESMIQGLNSTYAYRLYDWGRRQQTLEWVADWARQTGRTFKIYGRGWESHPTLSEFAAGVLEHGEQLRCANRASKLGLQLIPGGFRHQRSFELLACGTLPLTRYCEADFAFLTIEEFKHRQARGEELQCSATIFPDLDRIVFSSPEEFAALADRFLDDDDYRNGVREELAQVVKENYTYTAVVGKVTAAFKRHLQHLASTQPTSVS